MTRKLAIWLARVFHCIGRPLAEQFITIVIYGALEWDMPPSDIENIVDAYLAKTCPFDDPVTEIGNVLESAGVTDEIAQEPYGRC